MTDRLNVDVYCLCTDIVTNIAVPGTRRARPSAMRTQCSRYYRWCQPENAPHHHYSPRSPTATPTVQPCLICRSTTQLLLVPSITHLVQPILSIASQTRDIAASNSKDANAINANWSGATAPLHGPIFRDLRFRAARSGKSETPRR